MTSASLCGLFDCYLPIMMLRMDLSADVTGCRCMGESDHVTEGWDRCRQRLHAQNIKPVIKHCADEATPLSQMYLPLQGLSNKLQASHGKNYTGH